MPDSSVPESGFKITRIHMPVWKGLATITEQVSFINLKARAQKRLLNPW